MAKEKFDRNKPHVNVGTIGHVDHEDDINSGHYKSIGVEGFRRVQSVWGY